MYSPFDNLIIKSSQLVLRIPTDEEITTLAQVASQGIQQPTEPHFQDEALYNKQPVEIAKGLKEFIKKIFLNGIKKIGNFLSAFFIKTIRLDCKLCIQKSFLLLVRLDVDIGLAFLISVKDSVQKWYRLYLRLVCNRSPGS